LTDELEEVEDGTGNAGGDVDVVELATADAAAVAGAGTRGLPKVLL
jgi:hypothetical protein